MSLTRADVEKVAQLARLVLADDELDRMTAHLAGVLQYIEQLAELATDDVAPMAHVADVVNVFREDEVRPSLDRAAALSSAPKHDGECYLVPPVLGEG